MFLLLLTLCLASAAASEGDSAFADRFTPLAGTQPAQWRVVWTHDPATEATISWSTAEPGTRHRVVYEAASTSGGEAARPFAEEQPTHRDGPYSRNGHDEGPGATFHHARLTGLEPSTTYRFRLESDGVLSRVLHFETAPVDERPFSLLVGGDSRSGWEARCQMNTSIAEFAETHEDVLAFSHGGDYVMYGDSWDQWSKWLTHNELATTSDGRVLPIVPTRGNHDFGALFGEVFDDPGERGQAYYRTQLSPLASLVTLNSNIAVAGDQLTWLDGELEAARADSRWLLVSYHHPLYPAVKSPGDARAFWPPLFDEHGVDVALESDGHAIKRTVPIRADEAHPDGVVYLGEGGLGVPQRTPRTSPWYLQPPGLVTNGHHVIRVDFGPERLRTRILRMAAAHELLVPQNFRQVIPPHGRWRFLAGAEPPAGWMQPGFDTSDWREGPAGFGYGDDDDTTILDDMRGNYTRLYVRKTFDGEDPALEGDDPLTLMCRYDDGFIAYLNGVEVARGGIEPPEDPGDDPRVRAREATQVEAFPLDGAREQLRPGPNVLALVGYNRMRTDRDFTLDPWLAGAPHDGALAGGLAEIDLHEFSPRPR